MNKLVNILLAAILGPPGIRKIRRLKRAAKREDKASHKRFVKQLREDQRKAREYEEAVEAQRRSEGTHRPLTAHDRPLTICPECRRTTLREDYARETEMTGFWCEGDDCDFRFGTTGYLSDCPKCGRINGLNLENGWACCLYCGLNEHKDEFEAR